MIERMVNFALTQAFENKPALEVKPQPDLLELKDFTTKNLIVTAKR
jgi:hypothetical protein